MQHHRERKSTRLQGFDYSMPGAYFITVCTKNREFLFESNEAKLAAESAWQSLHDIFANIELGGFVVMPNQIHGIFWIVGKGAYRLHPGTWKNDDFRRDGQLPIPTKVEKFETRVNKLRGMIGIPIWQRSFHDRIIHDSCELERIKRYI